MVTLSTTQQTGAPTSETGSLRELWVTLLQLGSPTSLRTRSTISRCRPGTARVTVPTAPSYLSSLLPEAVPLFRPPTATLMANTRNKGKVMSYRSNIALVFFFLYVRIKICWNNFENEIPRKARLSSPFGYVKNTVVSYDLRKI